MEESSIGAGGYWPGTDTGTPLESDDPYEADTGDEPPIVIPPGEESIQAEDDSPEDRSPPRREVPTIAAPPAPNRPAEDPSVDESE